VSPAASRALRIVVSLALAAGLLALFLRNVDFAAVGRAIAAARVGWILTAVVISVLVIVIRTWRWLRLIERVGTPRFIDALAATFIGFAATTLLPARAGEVVRPVALSRSARLPLTPLLASIGLERLLDLLVVLVLFVFYALGGWAPAAMGGDELSRFALLRRSAIVLGLGTVTGLAFLSFLAARPDLSDRATAPFLRLAPERLRPRIAGIVRSFVEGLGALRTPGDVLVVAISSFVLWLTIALQVYATMRAFNLDFPYPVSFFVIAWSVIGLAIPTPGGVGGYHAAIKYALTGYYLVETNAAAAFALISHAVSFIPVTIVGLVFLAAGGLSLGKLADTPESPDAQAKPE
jgi:glycosyltransferase 2 family protein